MRRDLGMVSELLRSSYDNDGKTDTPSIYNYLYPRISKKFFADELAVLKY